MYRQVNLQSGDFTRTHNFVRIRQAQLLSSRAFVIYRKRRTPAPIDCSCLELSIYTVKRGEFCSKPPCSLNASDRRVTSRATDLSRRRMSSNDMRASLAAAHLSDEIISPSRELSSMLAATMTAPVRGALDTYRQRELATVRGTTSDYASASWDCGAPMSIARVASFRYIPSEYFDGSRTN
ncbi:hypothetical protein SCHPADRAFT_751899 [Schizopora paradoxa]|uniref:Uncharacterized protein n=1 Tax=Schizopora paradoxa TaxID=27342 RepID=A0A0H2QZV4_9AGAM|nr:hypothetical protein SCHPADRAFT_751899 [Schizopora paradoxa]